MKFRSTFFAIAAWALSLNAVAQETYGTLPPLHVDGNYLKDEQGNKVVLHGVMDTPNTYFNGGRWQGSKAQGWWDDYNDTGAKNCRTYFKKLLIDTAPQGPFDAAACILTLLGRMEAAVPGRLTARRKGMAKQTSANILAHV